MANTNPSVVNIQTQTHVEGVRDILLASQDRWLNALEVRTLFTKYDQFTVSVSDPTVNTPGLHFFKNKKFTDQEKDYERKNGNRRTQSSKKLDGDIKVTFTEAKKSIGLPPGTTFERRNHRIDEECYKKINLVLVHYRLVR